MSLSDAARGLRRRLSLASESRVESDFLSGGPELAGH